MVFVDMRMSPGWDSLETIENRWYVDPELEIVICTAYSDHPWEDVSRRVGNTDKLLILMKPFNSIEVAQPAYSLTKKWNLAYSVEQQIESLESLARQRAPEWRGANDRLQERIARRITEIEKDLPQNDAAAAFRQKEEFLAIMSHEMLMPMNELASTVNLLFDDALDPWQRAHGRPYRDVRKISWPSTTTCTSSWLVREKKIWLHVNDDGFLISVDRKNAMTSDANLNCRVLVIEDTRQSTRTFAKSFRRKPGTKVSIKHGRRCSAIRRSQNRSNGSTWTVPIRGKPPSLWCSWRGMKVARMRWRSLI